MKRWVKGILVSVIILLIIQFIGLVGYLILPNNCPDQYCTETLLILPAVLSSVPFIFLIYNIPSGPVSDFVQVLIFYLIYPALGALIGLIYDKVKSKKK